MQGLAGAFAGSVIGAVFSLINAWIRFGTVAISSLSFIDLFNSMAIATGVGVLLSLLGVFYPALIAARMQPVEAMRVEQ